jgi:hypothetical protein
MRATSAQYCTSFALRLVLALWPIEAWAIPEQESLDNLSRGTADVFISYVYQTGHAPDADDLLPVARAKCRSMGYTDAIRSLDPTSAQCLTLSTSGAKCMRKMATQRFDCAFR